MLSRPERERLFEAAVAPYTERGYGGSGREWMAQWISIPRSALENLFSAEQEELVLEVKTALAGVVEGAAAAVPAERHPPRSAVLGALGGAEMVTRGEILAGRADEVPALFPCFAYLATLPYLNGELSLRLSRLSRRRLDEAAGRTSE